MLTEEEYRAVLRENEDKRQRAERLSRGEPEPERGYPAPLPSNLTSRQKLDISNANFEQRCNGFQEPPLTDAERGMSQVTFDRLPARRRNDIYTSAMFERRRKAEGNS